MAASDVVPPFRYGRDEVEWDELADAGLAFLMDRARFDRVTSYTEMNIVISQRTGFCPVRLRPGQRTRGHGRTARPDLGPGVSQDRCPDLGDRELSGHERRRSWFFPPGHASPAHPARRVPPAAMGNLGCPRGAGLRRLPRP